VSILYADDAAHLVTDEPVRYALGEPGDPLYLVLNAADADGVMWVCEEPEGWDAPVAQTPLDRRQDGHGAYAGETTYEERVLSFTGSAEAPTPAAARAARRRLLRAWSQSVLTGAPILYTHLDEEPPLSLWVAPSGQPKLRITEGRWLDFAFVMVAEDPIKFGAEGTYGPTNLPNPAGQPGVASPLTTPITTTGGSPGLDAVTVPNDGDEPADALYVITGPVPRPVVQVAGAEYLGLRLDLGALDTAVIDTAAGTVEVNGVNRYDAWLAGSTFPRIPPGGAEVRLRSTAGGTDPAAALTITTADRYR
jgi:hypothetical protein